MHLWFLRRKMALCIVEAYLMISKPSSCAEPNPKRPKVAMTSEQFCGAQIARDPSPEKGYQIRAKASSGPKS